MVHTIVDRFAPQQVVLFGSYARGPDGRCDPLSTGGVTCPRP
jgi:hypothetical protein